MDVKDILARVKAKKEKRRLKPEDRLPYWERGDGKDQGTPESARQRSRGNAGTMLDCMLAAGLISPEDHSAGARFHFLFKVRFAVVWERDPRQRDDQEKLEQLYRDAVREAGTEGSRALVKACCFDEPADCRAALKALVRLWSVRPAKEHRGPTSWRAEDATPRNVGDSKVIYVREYSWQKKRRKA